VTNKEKIVRRLKFIRLVRNITLSLLFVFFISCLIAGGVFENNLLFYISIALLGFGVICASIKGLLIAKTKRHIGTYCPECDNPSLLYTRTTKENTGIFRTVLTARRTHKWEVVRETIYYKCKDCGHETHSSTTYLRED